jgi:hypothetical protein
MSSSTLFRLGGLAAISGGVLWALFPLVSVFSSIEETRPGTAAHLAVATLLWLMAVVPLVLLLVGLRVVHTLLRSAYGQLGNAGFLVSFVALVLMFLGNALEVASLTFSGSESDTGHLAFLIGFLLLLIGSVLFGLAIRRVRHDPTSRLGWLLLVGALPLGILLALVLGAVAPETDLGFWTAITVPYGVAWMLLGSALLSHRAEPVGQPAPVA